ncbi:nitrite reductase small subunit NirD [Yinghuangia sp. YIM S09857]|uniref:nitrite reductase small subunit NirD n=1 Tax=Yinghuangia sp. YIM S09857 TaxID=3436929 RepID=UPI003F539879
MAAERHGDALAGTATLVEIGASGSWTPVCRLSDLIPGRGVAALVDGEQVAVFADRDGAVYAVGNRDPFSGAYVISRGILGSRQGVPMVMSPMYKEAFDLRTGLCLDADDEPVSLPVYEVRLRTAVGAEVG